MMETVVTFTDTYLPTINGVSYTITTWRKHWEQRGGDMPVIYPRATGYQPAPDEYPVPSIPFPFYDGFRIAVPWRSPDFSTADIVHVHTPFSLGIFGNRFASEHDLPIIASYHTPAGEYTDYLAPHPALASGLKRITERYERWFLNNTDLILTPSENTCDHLRSTIGVTTPIHVLPNGVDTTQFRPVDPDAFLDKHGIVSDKPLVGYTGRHGYEKRLTELIEAASSLEVTLVFGGDGPARSALEQQADQSDVDAYFLGFLDREELPAFYSALDVFAFPSPIETQGIVAVEAVACGTPVVAASSAALLETIDNGVTGIHFTSGDVREFRSAIDQALACRDELHEACLDSRDKLSVEQTVDRLESLYRSV